MMEVAVSLAVVVSAVVFVFGFLAPTSALAGYAGPAMLISLAVLVLTMLLSGGGPSRSGGNAMGRRWVFRR
ncbi:MAG: hypothetical protein ACYS9X_06405 [Planctomycetota bacterium]|jgi:peptidoglycan/LPS O-acetylase OafA/YrhL